MAGPAVGGFSRGGVAALTGETDLAERERIYAGIADGSVDIVLTTPEFAQCHAKRLASSGDFGFIAVDEAHHMAERGARRRIAYAGLSSLVEALGNPVVLALTAPAPTVVAETADDVITTGATLAASIAALQVGPPILRVELGLVRGGLAHSKRRAHAHALVRRRCVSHRGAAPARGRVRGAYYGPVHRGPVRAQRAG